MFVPFLSEYRVKVPSCPCGVGTYHPRCVNDFAVKCCSPQHVAHRSWFNGQTSLEGITPPGYGRQELFDSHHMHCNVSSSDLFIFSSAVFCFPFSAFTLLVGRQEGNPARKMLGVGLLMVTISLELCTSYSSSCQLVTTTFITLSSNKIQNRDILVPANPAPPGKWPFNCLWCFNNVSRAVRRASGL